MIHIVDYGLGNVQAFVNMFKRLGYEVVRSRTATDLSGATKIILPGVGAFDHAMELLNDSGMRPALDELVTHKKVPVLGICVGMQILANGSEEGHVEGLGWVPGRVRSFRSVEKAAELPLPHMGWNDVQPTHKSALFKGLESDAKFYFLHSFFFEVNDAVHTSATVFYGLDFSCAVSNGNVFGVQFHPEKSHHFGTLLLKNFAEL